MTANLIGGLLCVGYLDCNVCSTIVEEIVGLRCSSRSYDLSHDTEEGLDTF